MCSVLPVRELGKLCSKVQSTEEVHNDDCTGDDDGLCKIKKEMDPFVCAGNHLSLAAVRSYGQKIVVAIHSASVLPDHFTPDIPTPPPNEG